MSASVTTEQSGGRPESNGGSTGALPSIFQPQLFIDGNWRPAIRGETFDTTDPSDGRLLATVAAAGPADVDAAVRAARRAFEAGEWPRMSATERGKVLLRFAALVREHAEELAALEARDAGKPISNTLGGDVPFTADSLEYYAGAANKLYGETIPVPGEHLAMTLREPLGVVAAITPFNYPLVLAAWKIGPSLACGNTVVLKPSEYTPLTSLALAALGHTAGLPDGVLNVVTGLGASAGAALVAHPGVDKITFTGSTGVGKEILRAAAANLTGVTAELGGKSPNVVFADAPLDDAVEGALGAIFQNKGEDCCAGSRLLIPRPIYAEFVGRLSARAREIRVGPTMDRQTEMGPLIAPRQLERTERYVALARGEGARVACGGERLGGVLQRGLFFGPTVLTEVQNRMRVAQEEVFGPVVCAIPFDSDDDAISLANETPYGLAAAVWTRDITRALNAICRIHAGNTWINTYHRSFVEATFGGFKQSGVGGRECGMQALEAYSRRKNVVIHLAESGPRFFS